MKKWKKMLVSLLTICLFSALSTTSVLAADGEYEYTLTISGGNKATVHGVEKFVESGLQADSTFIFNMSSIQLSDEKYYVRGLRRSGTDEEPILGEQVPIEMKSDLDYVVVYGIAGDMVQYTVNYHDADGNELAPSSTFYGNVGDKPVVAYKYIENYVPEVLAFTKTLNENEAENVFTFVYNPGETGEVVEEVVVVPGETGEATAGTAAGTTGGTVGTVVEGGAAAGEEAAGEGEGEELVESPDEDTPESLVDLDDEETPTSNVKLDEEKIEKSMPLVGQIAIIAGAVIALGILIFALKKRAK